MRSIVTKLLPARVLSLSIILILATACLRPALANTFATILCPASFPDSIIREVGANPSDVEVRDLDGDSIPDLAVVTRYPNAVSVLRGLGNGTLGPEERYSIGQISSKLEIGDIDSDGYADMVVTMDFVAHLGVFWGRPDGGFDSLATYPAVGLFSLNIADMDGDGRDDVVYTTERENAVTVVWGNDTRTLEERTSYSVPLTPFFVALGDPNGDGLPDMAMNGGDSLVYQVLNLGQRQFTLASVALALPVSVEDFSYGDLDGDRYQDIVVLGVGTPGSGAAGLSTGDGRFHTFPISVPGNFPVRVKVADLNGDGWGDLVVGCQTSQDARLLLGHGDGTFDCLTRLHGENCVADVGARDLNRDGSPDVVILAGCSYMLSIFPNSQTHTAGSVRFAPIVYAKGQRSTPLVAQVVLPTGASHQWDSSSVSLLWRGAVLGTAFSASIALAVLPRTPLGQAP